MIISLKKQIEQLTEKQTQQIEELKQNQIIGNYRQENIEKYIEELKDKPNITNNILQLI